MSERYQTTGPGRCILQPASTVLSDHVTRALDEARQGRRAWIKSRGPERDDRLWSIEFAPNADEPHRPTVTVWAWRYPVPFDHAGNPGWTRQVRTILDRLSSPIPGGTR